MGDAFHGFEIANVWARKRDTRNTRRSARQTSICRNLEMSRRRYHRLSHSDRPQSSIAIPACESWPNTHHACRIDADTRRTARHLAVLIYNIRWASATAVARRTRGLSGYLLRFWVSRGWAGVGPIWLNVENEQGATSRQPMKMRP